MFACSAESLKPTLPDISCAVHVSNTAAGAQSRVTFFTHL
jgi:hypothetical protein